jgi:hypothetical protein
MPCRRYQQPIQHPEPVEGRPVCSLLVVSVENRRARF